LPTKCLSASVPGSSARAAATQRRQEFCAMTFEHLGVQEEEEKSIERCRGAHLCATGKSTA
jgi:hypothetical protein